MNGVGATVYWLNTPDFILGHSQPTFPASHSMFIKLKNKIKYVKYTKCLTSACVIIYVRHVLEKQDCKALQSLAHSSF